MNILVSALLRVHNAKCYKRRTELQELLATPGNEQIESKNSISLTT